MPGAGARISWAFRCFFTLLFKGRLPDDVLNHFRPPAGAAAPPVEREDAGDRAVQLLAILQRDGRLVDFLQEELSGYGDAQIGAAVRDVHASCRAALGRYVTLEPVLTEAEGDRVRTDRETDPARLKIVGTVSASAAREGIVRHRGWRAVQVSLPPLPAASARQIVAPAEVEVA
jgi:hypothetical protein